MLIEENNLKKDKIKLNDLNNTEKKFLVLFGISKLYFVSAVIILYLIHMGLDFIEISILDGIFWGSILIFEIPTGWIADRYGRKTSMFLAYFLQGISLLGLYLFSQFIVLVITFGIWGMATTLRSGAEQAWIYDQITSEIKETGKRKEINGNYRFHGVFSILMATGLFSKGIGDIMGGYLATFDISLPLLFTAGTSLISSFFLLSIPENKNNLISKNKIEENKISRLKKAVNDVTDRKVILLVITMIFLIGLNSSLLTWAQAYFNIELRIKLFFIGIIYGLTTFISAAGSSKSQVIGIKYGEKIYFLMPFILSFIFSLMAFEKNIMSIMIFIVGAFFAGILNPFLITKTNQFLSPESRATALSVISALSTISVMLIEIITAVIINKFGFFYYFIFLSLSYMVFVGIILIIWRRQQETLDKQDHALIKTIKKEEIKLVTP